MASTSKTKQMNIEIDKKKKTKFDLTEEQKSDIKEIFEVFDSEGTGKIAIKDIKYTLRALGYDSTVKEIQTLVLDVAPEYPKEITYEQYVKVMTTKMRENKPDETLKMFHLFDYEKTGRISFFNLKTIATELGEDLTDEEIRDMIQEADEDGDGKISLEEFIKFYNKEHCFVSRN